MSCVFNEVFSTSFCKLYGIMFCQIDLDQNIKLVNNFWRRMLNDNYYQLQ